MDEIRSYLFEVGYYAFMYIIITIAHCDYNG